MAERSNHFHNFVNFLRCIIVVNAVASVDMHISLRLKSLWTEVALVFVFLFGRFGLCLRYQIPLLCLVCVLDVRRFLANSRSWLSTSFFVSSVIFVIIFVMPFTVSEINATSST